MPPEQGSASIGLSVYVLMGKDYAMQKPEVRSALRAFVYPIKSLWKMGEGAGGGKEAFLQKSSFPPPAKSHLL
jgi:hypothetical protein